MTLEEYRNQQHEIDLVFFHGIFKTQNAHGGRNVMPRCLSEGVDIFLKSADRQGEKITPGGSSKKVYGGFRHRCHDRDTDRADLRCDETDFLSELPGQIRPDQLVF